MLSGMCAGSKRSRATAIPAVGEACACASARGCSYAIRLGGLLVCLLASLTFGGGEGLLVLWMRRSFFVVDLFFLIFDGGGGGEGGGGQLEFGASESFGGVFGGGREVGDGT